MSPDRSRAYRATFEPILGRWRLDGSSVIVDTGAVKRRAAPVAPRGNPSPTTPHRGTRGAHAAPRPDALHHEQGGAAAEHARDPATTVAANLKRLRLERGLSLERLANLSGVSRAMLGQIELGKSTPTLNVVWKIVRALDVPFSALITEAGAPRVSVISVDRSKLLRSRDGAFSSRALFPMDRPRNVELYELRLAPLANEPADPHPPGTTENLVVSSGTLELSVGAEKHLLATGEAVFFVADVPHAYRNPGNVEAVMYLVMTYPQRA